MAWHDLTTKIAAHPSSQLFLCISDKSPWILGSGRGAFEIRVLGCAVEIGAVNEKNENLGSCIESNIVLAISAVFLHCICWWAYDWLSRKGACPPAFRNSCREWCVSRPNIYSDQWQRQSMAVRKGKSKRLQGWGALGKEDEREKDSWE